MRMIGLSLAALLVALPAQAQLFERLFNPDVEVTLQHPAGLKMNIRRVAFAPVTNPVEEELLAACLADLSNTELEIMDRGNLEKVLKEQKFSNSGLVDSNQAVELGRLLGSPVLLLTKVHQYKVTRTPLKETRHFKKDGKQEVRVTYTSKTQADFSASVQAVDLATGKVFAAQRIVANPTLTHTSNEGQPDYPSDTEIREKAFQSALTTVRRLLLPWTEVRKLIFYDDKEYGMKEAHRRLKAKDYPGALTQAQDSLKQAKADPQAKPKHLGRTSYNVGMAYFILGDYDSALPYLFAAQNTDAENGIYREARADCERAITLMKGMAEAEAKGAMMNGGSLPTKATSTEPQLSPEERMERLDRLRKKGLISADEYNQKRNAIMNEL
ncbi:CsgG/HfaB family protein [Holophaga foetida]|uniref:CsgG/HfaB family protein n=1 Tax=Holophaga foetida TaxID=35839 RepID=UPI0002474D9D|nr:CsgG/HfaB family protein [Holophaga foetida]